MTEATTTNPTAVTPAADFHPSAMRIAKRVGNTNVFSKFLAIGIPTLDQAIPGAPAPDSWQEETVTEDGQTAVIRTPVYSNATLDYVQTALLQRIQGIARSKDSADLPVPSNWVELFESSGGIKYPVQLKAFKEALAEFLSQEGSGFTPAQVAGVLSYCDTRKLAEATEAKKARVSEILESFKVALGDQVSEVASVFAGLDRALAVDPDEVEF